VSKWTPPSTADIPVAAVKAVTTAAAISASTADVEQVILQNDPASTKNILVGNSSAQPIVLIPGAVIVLPCQRLADIYAKSSDGSSQNLNILGV